MYMASIILEVQWNSDEGERYIFYFYKRMYYIRM